MSGSRRHSQAEPSELIERYLEGDPEAVGIVDRWIESAALPFRRRLSFQWDDVLQSLRLEILQLFRKGRFRGDSTLKTYLWRVVNHSCVDQIRAQRRWSWIDPESSERVNEMADGSPPESVPLETADLLLRVLEEISERCKRIWRMLVAGLSYREMGRALGVSEGALRVQALRCRRRAIVLRDRLLEADAR